MGFLKDSMFFASLDAIVRKKKVATRNIYHNSTIFLVIFKKNLL